MGDKKRHETSESFDNSDIRVIYEDSNLLAVNKPAGLLVHETGQSAEVTLVDWFLEHSPEARGVGETMTTPSGKTLERSGVVHRLDRETAGVIVLAKNQDTYNHLKQQFQDRVVEKEYRAFVYGQLKESKGVINKKIGRSRRDPRLRSAEFGAGGVKRTATTRWEVLKQGEFLNESYAYLALFPVTGRTHQLRVHLKSIGKPIVGDVLYAPKLVTKENNLNLPSLALFAHKLTCLLPGKNEATTFTAPLPNSFLIAAANLSE